MPFEIDTCRHDKDLLLAAAEGRLSAGELVDIEAQCRACPACAAEFAQMRLFHQAAEQWRDEPVPAWNRAAAMPKPERTGLAWPQWLSLGASFAALVLALGRVDVRHDAAGWSLSLGQAPAASVAATGDLERRLKDFELSQAAYLENRLAERDEAQLDTTRELLKVVAAQSQRQRRQDLNALLTYWQDQQENTAQRLERRLDTVSTRQARSAQTLSELLEELDEKPAAQAASTTESL